MKLAISIISGIVIGFLIFAIASGLVAAAFTALANTAWSPSSGVAVLLGVSAEFIKYAVSIYGGYTGYKFVRSKLPKGEGRI